MSIDIRWKQRFQNLKKAFTQLDNAYKLSQERELSELEKQGLIQAFEYTHELSWKTLKDFLNHKGYTDLYGSKDVTKLAFEMDLVNDGYVWMEMIKSRSQALGSYEIEISEAIKNNILNKYMSKYSNLISKLNSLAEYSGSSV
ncbi:HI0074 family nucleotidyltransferase substrate-binding subunit [Flammeovirga yaeyamensis]|uniref:HI0074 family nucleotidyltransferase substrate-binding subunit n=1 Tax=Flammeovirga yaeyamensis TaxID=367791 RepID=A0AAX1N047_9BACT|nr:nucleotidyltransferase substrate binding protein [Flammeovirga yaeyamensis]MBB3700951.1 nucleotidyltransferase substrate binding protein (TIGR01987 family) [Flammeovirga yaeyamensis]NMF38057.1 nucleotidyltransferase [Flammeovirga yaeyamensis]QWG00707.1 HI0074 family nucleotidyltransferase substrate-binding subunit [Flammeovirga yaeyamensis]